jgi:hypothetical protein
VQTLDIKVDNKKNIIRDDEKRISKKTTKLEVLVYILLFIFTLNLVVLILKREKMF